MLNNSNAIQQIHFKIVSKHQQPLILRNITHATHLANYIKQHTTWQH